MVTGMPLPTVSVVTPSFNQVEFLERAMRSVLSQNYADIEYIVLDGGSSDGSVDIIRRYSDSISYWRSHEDEGQAAAISQGLELASGDVVTWLNSDDVYMPGTLAHVVELFGRNPDVGVVVGNSNFIDTDDAVVGHYRAVDASFNRLIRYWKGWPIPQPSTFFRRDAYIAAGGLDTSLTYVLDLDLFLRLSGVTEVMFTDRVLSGYRFHSQSKTGEWKNQRFLFWREARRVTRKYWGTPSRPRYWWMWAVSGVAQIGAYARYRLSGD